MGGPREGGDRRLHHDVKQTDSPSRIKNRWKGGLQIHHLEVIVQARRALSSLGGVKSSPFTLGNGEKRNCPVFGFESNPKDPFWTPGYSARCRVETRKGFHSTGT